MKTRARAQLDTENQAPESRAELQRLRVLLEKRSSVKKHRAKKAKALRRRNKKVDDYDMEQILEMRNLHKYTYKRIG